MRTRFLLLALLFHTVLCLVGVALAVRWSRRAVKPEPNWLWGLRLTADGVLFAWAALLTALLCGAAYPPRSFFTIRLLCQALFGEGIVILAAYSWLQLRGDVRERRRALVPLFAALLLLAIYWDAYHHCPYDLQIQRHSLDLARGRAAGAETHRLRLVHLSDIQTPVVGAYEERVFRTVRDLQPDLLVFSGDYVQSRLRPTRREAAIAFNSLLRRAQLHPRFGAFAVEGDVESSDWKQLFEGTGVRCLRNQSAGVRLDGNRQVTVVGLSLAASHGHDPGVVRKTLRRAARPDLVFVLAHGPDFVKSLPGGPPVDLVLAGHTHGGQIVLPGVGPLFTNSSLPKRYAGGLELFEGIPLEVSRGIGMERGAAPQVRFFCPPEVCVLEISY